MNRNIPNKPHPTPDPEKPHGGAWPERGSLARSIHNTPAPAEPLDQPDVDGEPDEPNYDSCFDDLNLVLSQSMQQPDPDPNLEPSAGRPAQSQAVDPEIGRPSTHPAKAPRTSEIFRSVIAGVDRPPAAGPSPPPVEVEPKAVELPDLGVVDQSPGPDDAGPAADRHLEGAVPWGQIALLSYASLLTLALIWLLWTGRVPRPTDAGEPAPERPSAVEAPRRSDLAGPDTPPPPIPPENMASLGRILRIGDLEVTPVAVEARSVVQVRSINVEERRRDRDCLVLRLHLRNRSADRSFSPLERSLIRERELRPIDPYIATSDGPKIRMFPLAVDSEWSIAGQEFPMLSPGESAETFVAAEPGSARNLPREMTWRVRLRIGVYRSDMVGVKFTREQVGHPANPDAEEEEG